MNRGRRGGVKIRLPEVEREDRALEQEGAHQHDGGGLRQQRALTAFQQPGDVRQRQRAECGVNRADAQQQEQRSHRADQQILDRRFDAEPVVGDADQHHRRHDHQFLKDEKRENVARVERAVQPRRHAQDTAA